MNFYPYDAPIILTDTLFSKFGGDSTLSSPDVRKVSYLLAEEKVSDDLATFLASTIVSGTYPYSPVITLEHAFIRRVILTRFIDSEEVIYYTVSGTANEYVNLFNDEYGLVDITTAMSNCHCHGDWRPYPYHVQVIYETGIVSGASYDPKILMASSIYASIMLNELIGHGNEGPGDVSITRFSNQEYSEQRRGLINTVYGGSPRAMLAHNLLNRFRKYRFVGI